MAEDKTFYIDTMSSAGKESSALEIVAHQNDDGTVDFTITNLTKHEASIEALWFSDGSRDTGYDKTNIGDPPDNVQGALPTKDGSIEGQKVYFDSQWIAAGEGFTVAAGKTITISNVDLGGAFTSLDDLKELAVRMDATGGSKGFSGLYSPPGGDDGGVKERDQFATKTIEKTTYSIDDVKFDGLGDFQGMVLYFDAKSGINQTLDVKGLVFTSGVGNNGNGSGSKKLDGTGLNGNGNGNPAPDGTKIAGNASEGILTVKVDFATLQKSGDAVNDFTAILDALKAQGVIDTDALMGVSFVQSNKLETFYGVGTDILHKTGEVDLGNSEPTAYELVKSEVDEDGVLVHYYENTVTHTTEIQLSTVTDTGTQINVDQSVKWAPIGDYTAGLDLYAADGQGGYAHTDNAPALVDNVVQNSYIDQTYSYGDLHA